MIELGVDFSEYGGDLAPATVQRWLQAGVRYSIVQYSQRMPQHLGVLNQFREMEQQAYVYLYFPLSPWQQTPEARVQTCINFIGQAQSPIQRVWLDVEVEGAPTDSAVNTVQALQRCEQLLTNAGFEPGIYTSSSMWQKMCANVSTFAHLPLWDANYVANRPAQMRPVNYGGWTKADIWQWAGTTSFEGHSVDLNIREGAGVPTGRLYEEKAYIDALSRSVLQINKGWAATDLKDYAPVLEEWARIVKGEL